MHLGLLIFLPHCSYCNYSPPSKKNTQNISWLGARSQKSCWLATYSLAGFEAGHLLGGFPRKMNVGGAVGSDMVVGTPSC